MAKDLRKQFLDYMALQRLSPNTQRNYIRAVKGLAAFYNQSPDTLTNDQIQDYLLYLLEDRKLSWGTCNNYFSVIVRFYRDVCKWDETRFKIPHGPGSRNCPSSTAWKK